MFTHNHTRNINQKSPHHYILYQPTTSLSIVYFCSIQKMKSIHVGINISTNYKYTVHQHEMRVTFPKTESKCRVYYDIMLCVRHNLYRSLAFSLTSNRISVTTIFGKSQPAPGEPIRVILFTAPSHEFDLATFSAPVSPTVEISSRSFAESAFGCIL